MKDQKSIDFGKAEALGQVKTMPKAMEDKAEEITGEDLTGIDSIDAFRIAVGNAQLEGLEYVEVSEKFFRYLVKNQKTPYLTYGDPGVKVFIQGTREVILAEESLNAEMYGDLKAKQRAQAVVDKLGRFR